MLRNSRKAARAIAAAAVLVLSATSAFAEAKRPAAAALIAAAKATALADFEVSEEIRGLKVEAWMRKLFGTAPIAWRATTCQAAAGLTVMVNSPICVEATVRVKASVVFTLGVGFDENAPRPERKPNAIWGAVEVRGKHCDFYRHPDQIQQGRPQMDEMAKAGRCL